MNFHQKLVVYYILDYFGILFILDINSVLIEFILLLVAAFTFNSFSLRLASNNLFLPFFSFELKTKLNRPRGYKTFFMLNSIEHEIFPAHKC